jgi:hypothetical protein
MSVALFGILMLVRPVQQENALSSLLCSLRHQDFIIALEFRGD